jgi:talin
LAKAVNAETDELLNIARRAEGNITDPTKKNMMASANNALASNNEHVGNMANILAPTVQDDACLNSMEKATKALEQSSQFALATAKSSGVDPNLQQQLNNQQAKVGEAIRRLLGVADLPQMADAKDASDFTDAAQTILTATASLMASQGNAPLIKQQAELLRGAAAKLGQSGKGILSTLPEGSRERMGNYLKQVVEATKGLLKAVPACEAKPNDENAHRILRDQASAVAEATHTLLGDAGKQVALSALYNSAKLAAANTVNLATASKHATKSLPDAEAQRALDDAARAAAEAVQMLVDTLRNARPLESSASSLNLRGRTKTSSTGIKDDIMQGCEAFAPVAYKLVSASKSSSARVEDADAKQNLVYSSSNAAKAIHQMLANRKALKAVKGQLESVEALEQFKAAMADLEAAMIAADTGILKSNKGKDEALAELAQATQDLGKATKALISTAKNNPEELGVAMKELAATATRAVAATSALAANIEDKNLQKGLLNALHGVLGELRNLMQVSKAVAANPDDQALGKLLLDAGKEVVGALVKLTEASKGVVPKKIEKHLEKSANDIEDLAERELQGAANAIENCVQKLLNATEDARQRMQEKGISLDEQNITEAILEAAQAIASATGVLVNAATSVQREFNKLAKSPDTGSVYKRDPQWAQGLISAAKTVAGAVQHLVTAANNAALGNASEEALVVAAQAVSAATTQLVVASTVKADPNSQSQLRLKDAASKVAHATQSLVDAARTAAKWEEEKETQGNQEAYALPNSKIREMEQQMAILRLEKELQKAREGLAKQRKEEYQANVNVDFKPGMGGAQQQNKPPVASGRGTAQAIRGAPRGGVNWQGPRGGGRGGPQQQIPPSQQ